jgi:hypothetical protein
MLFYYVPYFHHFHNLPQNEGSVIKIKIEKSVCKEGRQMKCFIKPRHRILFHHYPEVP